MSYCVQAINQAVASQYEAFPFPNYGLFLPLRWQEAYASHSSFAHALNSQLHSQIGMRPTGGILIAGCGDVFPSVISHWETLQTRIHAVDISSSNLLRSKLRCFTSFRSFDFQKLNLDEPLPFSDECFSHIDAYGVLHHLANPRLGLAQLAQKLAPGGTIRMMVYNRTARDWIHQIQKVFALLQLSPFIKEDLRDSLLLLEALARECPALKERLNSLLPEMRSRPTRLVDTFLHAREARLDLGDWLDSINDSGLRIIGMLDRYAELDDLPNPLYSMPHSDQLQDRCLDRRFENNWEFYLIKPGHIRTKVSLKVSRKVRWRTPPKQWFSYNETQNLSWKTKQLLWQSHLSYYSEQFISLDPKTCASIGELSLQRLLRIGAIWPMALPHELRTYLLAKPMYEQMEKPHTAKAIQLSYMDSCSRIVQSILLRKKRDPRLFFQLAKRIEAAQKNPR